MRTSGASEDLGNIAGLVSSEAQPAPVRATSIVGDNLAAFTQELGSKYSENPLT